MKPQSNAVLLVEKGSRAGQVFEVGPEPVILGRGQPEDGKVCFESHFVSRRHAEIRCEEGQFYVRDLGSTNGTRVNRILLEGAARHPLRHDDVIELADGDVVIRFDQSQMTARISGAALGLRPEPGLRVDEKAREIWVDGALLRPPLAMRDFEVLLLLSRNQGAACSKDGLARAWGDEIVTDEQIEQSIHRIRRRIESNPGEPKRLITIRGYGYKLSLV